MLINPSLTHFDTRMNENTPRQPSASLTSSLNGPPAPQAATKAATGTQAAAAQAAALQLASITRERDQARDDARAANERAQTLAAALLALTWDGTMTWDDPDPDDALVAEAVRSHQFRDKGMGPALGPAAGGTRLFVVG